MTPKQRAALKLGEAIRNVLCADSIANRYFEPDLREKMRELCDEQMHRLGRESLTEHRKRITEIFETHVPEDWPSAGAFRYQKLEDKE